MISVDDAQRAICQAANAVPQADIFLADAAGRVVACDLVSKRAVPGRDNSAMDGYGLKAADVESATKGAPVALTCVGAVTAGAFKADLPSIERGQAVRIMTGAPVPDSVDSVIMREQCDENGVSDDGTGTVHIQKAVTEGQNIRKRGEDVGIGDVVVTQGTRLSPAHLNTLAQTGHVVVPVARTPQVAILACGDELKELGSPLCDDDIVNSNAHSIAAAVRAAGAQAHLLGIAKDSLDDHVRRLSHAAFADVVITIGGVSAGTHDFVRPALEKIGTETIFWKVAMRPGKPIIFARKGSQLFLGLPGNPVSAQVAFTLFVEPLLKTLLGQTAPLPQEVPVVMRGETKKVREDFEVFLRAEVSIDGDGALQATLLAAQGSGQMRALADATALVIAKVGKGEIHDGDRLPALLLKPDVIYSRRA